MPKELVFVTLSDKGDTITMENVEIIRKDKVLTFTGMPSALTYEFRPNITINNTVVDAFVCYPADEVIRLLNETVDSLDKIYNFSPIAKTNFLMGVGHLNVPKKEFTSKLGEYIRNSERLTNEDVERIMKFVSDAKFWEDVQ